MTSQNEEEVQGQAARDAASAVLLQRQGPIAILRLNRPAKHNAVNERMAAEAAAALDAIEANDEARVIIVTGAGERAFCAGQDMAEASGRTPRPEGMRGGGARGLAERLSACRKPIIAAINGLCYGGGMSIALACDLRLASEQATFRLPGTSYGLVVSAGMLAAAVGPAAAKDLLFTARVFDAPEALTMKLVNRLTPANQLYEVALAYAGMIADNSPQAIERAKRVVNLATLSRDALNAEVEADRALRGGNDHRDRFSQAADRVLKRG